MSMKKKLLKAYIQGCNDTWDLVDEAVKEVPGIGEKTQKKLAMAIREKANAKVDEQPEIQGGERRQLDSMIDQMAKNDR